MEKCNIPFISRTLPGRI